MGPGDEDDTIAEAAARRARRRLLRRTLAVGAMLGRYRILGELGQGGMGVVYRAHDAELGRDVAVKLVTTSDTPTDTLATRLLREAQALAQLSHPNVVAVYDVGRVEGGVFLAMELVEGETGEVWLKRRPSWREVLTVFRDAGRGLAAAHAVGLVHRDFKPGNLMLGSDGRVRVLDFGLARAAYPGAGGDAPDPSALSDTAATWSGDAAPLDVTIGEPPAATGPSAPSPSSSSPTSTSSSSSSPSSSPSSAPSAAPSSSPSSSSSSSSSRGSSSSRLLDTPLTQLGAIVGTPPYMAPEQHLGGGCDARTDQFSFCVAFYQALYGERPFAGANYAELSTHIVKGTLKPAPAASDVPSWLRAIVVRGLQVAPDRRWPSMNAILEAMAFDPTARRRRLSWSAAAVALVAVAGVATWHGLRDSSSVCKGAARQLDGVWDAARRQAMQAAFERTGRPYAADAVQAVTRALDRYSARWVSMHTDACEATRVRGTQSAELLDLRMTCLQQRLDDVRAEVELFTSADAEVVSRAAEVAQKLPPLDGCADAEALRAPLRPPADAPTRRRVAAARTLLAGANAQWKGGRYAEAKTRLRPALVEAGAIGYRPLEAEALLLQARLADSTGDYAAARSGFRDAALAAEAGRDDATAALAMNGLVWVTGERLGKYADAHELARQAQAKIERLGHPELLEADLDAKVAALFLEEGKYAEAQARSKKVLATRQKLLSPDDPAIGSALADLGDVSVQLAHYDEAIDDYERALAVIERASGPQHPMAGDMRINLGAALRAAGRTNEALVEYKRAQAIVERSLGREHPMLASIDLNVGAVLLDQGRLTEAATQFQRALEISRKTVGADHPNVATCWYRLGSVAFRQGRSDEARVDYQRALDIWQAKLGADHPSLSAALDGLGDAMLAARRPALALGYYRRSLALLEKAVGPNHPDLADALIGIGLSELAQGDARRASPSLERALALRESSGDALDIARARFALARAVAANGDRPRAVELADKARAVYARAAPPSSRELGEIDRWTQAINGYGVRH